LREINEYFSSWVFYSQQRQDSCAIVGDGHFLVKV
jgi:hypothetical protein